MPAEAVRAVRAVEAVAVVVGLGANSAATVTECLDAIDRVVRPEWMLVGLSTIDRKRWLIERVAATLGVPWSVWSAEALGSIDVPNPSTLASAAVGSASVAEAAAILGSRGGRLVREKVAAGSVTVAVASALFQEHVPIEAMARYGGEFV